MTKTKPKKVSRTPQPAADAAFKKQIDVSNRGVTAPTLGRPLDSGERRVLINIYVKPSTLALVDDARNKTGLTRGRVVESAMALLVEYKIAIASKR